MLKLKFQCFGHLMWKTDSFEKTLMLGNIEGERRRGWQRMRWLDGITDWMDMSLSKLRGLVVEKQAWVLKFMGKESDMTEQMNWTELKTTMPRGAKSPKRRKPWRNWSSFFMPYLFNFLTNEGLSSQSYGFPVVMYGCESWTIKKLSTKELMLLNCGVGEDAWESLGLQGDPTSPS